MKSPNTKTTTTKMPTIQNIINATTIIGDNIVEKEKKVPLNKFVNRGVNMLLDGCMKPNEMEEVVCVEVKESPIHGRGVFATRDIKRGEAVCLYPADYVMLNYNGEVYTTKDNDMKDFDMDYAFSWYYKNQLIHIIGNKTKYTPLLCGHLVNDARLNMKELTYKKGDEKMLLNELIKYGYADSNVKLEKSKYVAYLRACKDIKKGEELLTSYGFSYWVKDNALYYDSLMNDLKKYINTLDKKTKAVYTNLINNMKN